MTATIEPTRNASLQDLMGILQEQEARKVDLVVPGKDLKFVEGQLIVEGQETTQKLTDTGVTTLDPNGSYLPTKVFDDSLADRLFIATKDLAQFRNGRYAAGKQVYPARLDLYDAVVNGLLHGRRAKVALEAFEEGNPNPKEPRVLREAIDADRRSFMLRLFRGERTGTGIARAILSNKATRLDNGDAITAMLQGIAEAGIDPSTLRISGDLSETRMYVTVDAPEIIALAPELLKGYRNPFHAASEANQRQTSGPTPQERYAAGQRFRDNGGRGYGHNIFKAGEEPIVHAGLKLLNSEVGHGRWMVVPFCKILECSNSATFEKEAFARTHVGGRLDDGVMEWSADTQTQELKLVTAQTRDIVAKVLSVSYVEAKVAELEGLAGKEIAKPEETITVLSNALKFSEEERNTILRHFLMGGQSTTGGILNAITSASQTIADADRAYDLDRVAVRAMELAYAMK